MKNDWLNLPPEEWNKKELNYFQVLSILLFIGIIYLGFQCLLLGDSLQSTTRDNIWLRAENTALKLEIERGNEQVNKEFNPYGKKISVYKSKWEGENE